jgi:hypothetical protein
MSKVPGYAIMVVAMTALCACAAAEDRRSAGREEAAYSSKSGYRLELKQWQDEAMCRTLDAAVQSRWDAAGGRLCSIPVKDAGPEFSLPEWRAVDGQELLPEIRELALLKDWSGPLQKRTASLGGVNVPRIAPAELVEQVWMPMESDFASRLASGKLQVEEARFDFDNNGESETVYRVRGWTLAETGRPEKPFEPAFWEPEACEPGGIDSGFIFFTKRGPDDRLSDLADLLISYAGRRASGSQYYVFQYEGRTFQHWSYSTAVNEIPGSEHADYCDWQRRTN